MISIQHVNKAYKEVAALQDVNLELAAGKSVAVIGPNGSGKSTLMKSILGLVRPDNGIIQVNGKAISDNEAYRSAIGYMPQIIRFPENMRVAQLFNMMRDIRQSPEHIDEELYLSFQIASMSNKPLGGLSGGMKQKVNAALAFLFDPMIIILDEPTAGLDPLAAEILKDKVRKEKAKGKLILISSHIMADLEEITTDVLFMMEGCVAFYKDLDTLKQETGENNLGRSIAYYMKHKNLQYETH